MKLTKQIKVALLAIYSEKYAMTGETHGISVLAGVITNKYQLSSEDILVMDMYAYDQIDREKKIIDSLMNFKPNFVGFSCPYGSYEYIKDIFPSILQTIDENETIIIFGGALPTYIPHAFIKDIYQEAIVIAGEGENAICGIIDAVITGTALNQIPSISYYKHDTSEIIDVQRKQVDLFNICAPYRKHLPFLLAKKAQIFVENSRGCSWGQCTFCSRKMYTDNYSIKCYRRFPLSRLEEDLINLSNYGTTAVTFADEDFCGSGLEELTEIIQMFERLNLCIRFDVSMNVRTIYSNEWSDKRVELTFNALDKLKKHGLRKVFLGVESGSITQLKRYKKGHTPVEAIQAINFLRRIKVDIEIGFILFDPLCTLEEVKENIEFLCNNELAEITSSLGSGLELRLHIDSPYVKLLNEFESATGIALYRKEYQNDYLNYTSFYANESVKKLSNFVKVANKTIRPLYYPLKSLSRYGEYGSLGKYTELIKGIVVKIRQKYIARIRACAFGSLNEDMLVSNLSVLKKDISTLFTDNKMILHEIATETGNGVLADVVLRYSELIEEICKGE
jgi:radical SAM superfamily enzyme YgiQ (UPF0313 family)